MNNNKTINIPITLTISFKPDDFKEILSSLVNIINNDIDLDKKSKKILQAIKGIKT